MFVVLILLPVLSFAAPPPGIPDGWSDGYVYANGIRVHYYHAIPNPGKPVMVMVHGVTDNGLCWTTLTWKLQDAYDIYMVDTHGHGLSDPFTPADNGETLVKDVVEFVRAMKFERPILVGHSMGRQQSCVLAAERPDLAKAIIMLDPFVGRGGPGGGGPGARGRQSRETNTNAATTSVERGPPPKAAETKSSARKRLSVSMNGIPELLAAQNNTASTISWRRAAVRTRSGTSWIVSIGRCQKNNITVLTRVKRGRRCREP